MSWTMSTSNPCPRPIGVVPGTGKHDICHAPGLRTQFIPRCDRASQVKCVRRFEVSEGFGVSEGANAVETRKPLSMCAVRGFVCARRLDAVSR
jgi:hypothetical protein